MARIGLLLLLSLGGCLFVGDVNQRPGVSMRALSAGELRLGAPITLEAYIDDDQADVTLDVVVRDQDGVAVTDPCQAGVTPLQADPSSTYRSYQLTLWRVGSFTVEATPTDRLGARGSSSTVAISVIDAPPTFSPGIGELRPGSAPTACSALYPTGRPVPIILSSAVDDPEQSWTPPPIACVGTAPGRLRYTWHLVNRPVGSGGVLGRPVAGACPDAPSGGGLDIDDEPLFVCLYPDANLPTATPSTYGVALDVTDGTSVIRSDTLSVPVVGDAPACLDGAYPQVGSYVIDRGVPSVFQVVGVDDVDAASQLAYTWTLERPGEASFTVLDGADGTGRLVFDPVALGLAVGDDVRLRVEVGAPDQAAPACDPADDACAAGSCAAAPATTCPRRATWSLEIR